MSSFTPQDLLSETVAAYAQTLMVAGFTVYLDAAPRPYMGEGGGYVKSHHFVYSREDEDGRELFGIFDTGTFRDSFNHTMPIRPSREHGSAAVIRTAPGTDPLSVEMATAVAQPFNIGIYLGPRNRAGYATGGGVRVENAKPWGVGRYYLPAILHSGE